MQSPKKARWIWSPACMNLSTVLSKADEHQIAWYLSYDHVLRLLPTVAVSKLFLLAAFMAENSTNLTFSA